MQNKCTRAKSAAAVFQKRMENSISASELGPTPESKKSPVKASDLESFVDPESLLTPNCIHWARLPPFSTLWRRTREKGGPVAVSRGHPSWKFSDTTTQFGVKPNWLDGLHPCPHRAVTHRVQTMRRPMRVPCPAFPEMQ